MVRSRYFFALVAVNREDIADSERTAKLFPHRQLSFGYHDEDLMGYKHAVYLHEEVKALRKSVDELHVNLSTLKNLSTAANTEDDDSLLMWTDSGSIRSFQSRSSFQKRVGPLSRWSGS